MSESSEGVAAQVMLQTCPPLQRVAPRAPLEGPGEDTVPWDAHPLLPREQVIGSSGPLFKTVLLSGRE